MTDYIESLPIDNSPMSNNEMYVMQNIFGSDTNVFYNLIEDAKSIIIASIVFFLLNVPQIQEFLRNTIPYAKTSEMSLLILKTILFIIIVFLLNNIQFAKK